MSHNPRVHLLGATPDWRGYLYEGHEFDIHARRMKINRKVRKMWFHKGVSFGTLSEARDAGTAHINALILCEAT